MEMPIDSWKADLLHIFGQSAWHDGAYVVGTSASLRKLRDAIDRAINSGGSEEEFFVNDGEGYAITVIKTDTGTMEKIGVPYSDEMARERSDTRVKHWELWKKGNV